MAIEVPAVNAAVRILEMLAAEVPEPVFPARMVNELELNRSTCYNILSTLQKLGWAKNLGERSGWTLGPKLLTLTGISNELVLSVVQQDIEALSRKLGFVVFVAERVGDSGYTVIAKAENVRGLRVTVSVGDHFPYGAPALMHAFESWAPGDEFERRHRRNGAVAFTAKTPTGLELVRARLAEARRDGYARSVQEFDMSQGAVASPIFDAHARAHFALCTVAFYTDINEESIGRIGPALRETAERITHRTGGVLPEVSAEPAGLTGTDGAPAQAPRRTARI